VRVGACFFRDAPGDARRSSELPVASNRPGKCWPRPGSARREFGTWLHARTARPRGGPRQEEGSAGAPVDLTALLAHLLLASRAAGHRCSLLVLHDRTVRAPRAVIGTTPPSTVSTVLCARDYRPHALDAAAARASRAACAPGRRPWRSTGERRTSCAQQGSHGELFRLSPHPPRTPSASHGQRQTLFRRWRRRCVRCPFRVRRRAQQTKNSSHPACPPGRLFPPSALRAGPRVAASSSTPISVVASPGSSSRWCFHFQPTEVPTRCRVPAARRIAFGPSVAFLFFVFLPSPVSFNPAGLPFTIRIRHARRPPITPENRVQTGTRVFRVANQLVPLPPLGRGSNVRSSVHGSDTEVPGIPRETETMKTPADARGPRTGPCFHPGSSASMVTRPAQSVRGVPRARRAASLPRGSVAARPTQARRRGAPDPPQPPEPGVRNRYSRFVQR